MRNSSICSSGEFCMQAKRASESSPPRWVKKHSTSLKSFLKLHSSEPLIMEIYSNTFPSSSSQKETSKERAVSELHMSKWSFERLGGKESRHLLHLSYLHLDRNSRSYWYFDSDDLLSYFYNSRLLRRDDRLRLCGEAARVSKVTRWSSNRRYILFLFSSQSLNDLLISSSSSAYSVLLNVLLCIWSICVSRESIWDLMLTFSSKLA